MNIDRHFFFSSLKRFWECTSRVNNMVLFFYLFYIISGIKKTVLDFVKVTSQYTEKHLEIDDVWSSPQNYSDKLNWL